MKTIIVYKSVHCMNTEMVAKAMADAINASIVKVEEIKPEDLAGYDLIGFGSGIYGGKHHKTLFDLIERMPRMEKNMFIFSSSGVPNDRFHQPLREKLIEKGGHILGEFNCPGETKPLGFNLDLKGPLGWLAGKNKGHPDDKDLEDAREFVKVLVST